MGTCAGGLTRKQAPGIGAAICLQVLTAFSGAGGRSGRLISQLVGQAHESRQVQLLGAQAAIHSSGLDGGAVEQAFKGIAQGLATLVERIAHHPLKQLRVLGRMRQHVMRHQPDDGRVHFRRRVECAGAYVEQVFDAAVVLDRKSVV